jgi:periplasmic protein TonB
MAPRTPRQAFPAPMAFSLGAPTASPRSRPRVGRGIDISLGHGVVGAADTRIFGRSDSKEVGPDWYNRFAAWWDRHGYYPPQAGESGQQGDVSLDLVVLRSGRVQRVALIAPSGSQWLDMAALGVFRGARLPSLPSDAAETVPIHLTIHYQILRR